MKIGMVLDQIFPPDHRVEKEAISLSQNGHDVFLLCLRDKHDAALRDYKGITLVSVYIPMFIIKKLRALTNTIFNFYPYLWFFLIRRFIKKYKIDVLHIHDLYMFKAGLLARSKAKKVIPIVGDLHENYVDALPEYRFSTTFPGNILINIDKWRKTERKWVGEMDYIITVVDEMRNRIKPYLKNESNAVVIDNSVDIESFLNYERDNLVHQKYETKFIVSYIGGFDIHRGLNILIEAIAQLKDLKDLLLVIVGRMDHANHIRRQITQLNVEDKVIFESFKPMGLLQNYFEISDIGIIPHIKSVQTDNSSPNKLYQYMLMATPVIVSNCNSIMNIVESERAGLVFKSGDPIDLAEKIRKIYEDKNLAREFGENGRNVIYQSRNWSENTIRLNDLYIKIEMLLNNTQLK
jgi:glycosyltransferase involved in cell wall biosynthesis